MNAANPQRILIADDNPDFRERLAHCLRARGHDVITAETGERAFLALRDWRRPIDWLYTRATLPGLIDGWILADEYHETHQNRAAVISGAETRISSRGDIVLKQPMPPTAFEAILGALSSASQQ
ncbi:response regulator [Microvirga sp. KLBC 81]|uniref:response regulator n=1 Tax=Microvirga sp. KLBC 81 TaxID=1862707 RepID=UPI000D50DBFD|nr:response regulator [Microvirga sp. KLBC 81]PVE21988.1 response regulator [Microvirga sp. KLBC 81]